MTDTTDPTSPEGLKACPFCGERPIGPFNQKYPDVLLYAIQCKCGANVAGHMTAPMAVRAWNRRTPAAEAPQPTREGELRRALIGARACVVWARASAQRPSAQKTYATLLRMVDEALSASPSAAQTPAEAKRSRWSNEQVDTFWQAFNTHHEHHGHYESTFHALNVLLKPNDDPAIDDLAWDMLQVLHSNVPEDKRPMSWSDFSDEQTKRAREAVYAILDRIKPVAQVNAPQLRAIPPDEAIIDRLVDIIDAHTVWEINRPAAREVVKIVLDTLREKRFAQPASAGFREALKPFAALGGGQDMQAFHDLEDDVIIYQNSGSAITAGDVRNARRVIAADSGSAISEMNFRRE